MTSYQVPPVEPATWPVQSNEPASDGAPANTSKVLSSNEMPYHAMSHHPTPESRSKIATLQITQKQVLVHYETGAFGRYHKVGS